MPFFSTVAAAPESNPVGKGPIEAIVVSSGCHPVRALTIGRSPPLSEELLSCITLEPIDEVLTVIDKLRCSDRTSPGHASNTDAAVQKGASTAEEVSVGGRTGKRVWDDRLQFVCTDRVCRRSNEFALGHVLVGILQPNIET